MNYEQAIAYLLSFADFERSGRFQDRPDVAPVLALLHALGDPHRGRATVHVAGSKGKGGVCAMIDAVLRASGLRPDGRASAPTGLYTSPHLHSYTERIRIDGEAIAPDAFARTADRVREAVEAVRPHLPERSLVTFDLLTAMGFLAFRDAAVAAQVLETGLGGRVDSTNVFETKEVAVITPISFEHTAILGDTIEQIAREKAAIITPGCTVVVAPQPYPAAERVIRELADRAGAPVVDVAMEYRWEKLSHDLHGQRIRIEGPHGMVEAKLPLLGRHQLDNAATALAVVDILRAENLCAQARLDETIPQGLESVHWPARFEVLREKPLVIADGAHNRDSARAFVATLREYVGRDSAVFVVGSSADKDIDALAQELTPAAERVFAVRADHPRAMDPALIAEAFQRAGVFVEPCAGVREAIDRALAITDATGVICVLGSLFVAAEAREYLLGLMRNDPHPLG